MYARTQFQEFCHRFYSFFVSEERQKFRLFLKNCCAQGGSISLDADDKEYYSSRAYSLPPFER